jgi:integrase
MDNKKMEAVLWAKNRLKNLPSIPTQDQYEKIVLRMYPDIGAGILPGSLSANRNTRAIERAAFRYVAAVKILKYAEANPQIVCNIFKLVETIDTQANIAQQNYQNGINYKSGQKINNHQKRASKRPSLTGLAMDWRQNLLTVSASSPYADAIRIMAICGCRPAELQKGVVLERQDNTITITIKGAKCSDITDAGQEWRTLTFDSDHPLIENISAGTFRASAHGIGDAVSHFGKKISNKKNPISAYSLRHAAASNFKASGLTKKEIASALGHRSTATMSLYGTRSRGSGIVTLISVSAASPVREPRNKSKPKI